MNFTRECWQHANKKIEGRQTRQQWQTIEALWNLHLVKKHVYMLMHRKYFSQAHIDDQMRRLASHKLKVQQASETNFPIGSDPKSQEDLFLEVLKKMGSATDENFLNLP